MKNRALENYSIAEFEDYIKLQSLDYSENKILNQMHSVSLYLLGETYLSLLSVSFTDGWWAKKIKEKNMLHLFEISSGDDTRVYDALLFCFSHQGSTKGLYSLMRALFGEQANIEFDVKKHEINIKTNVDNQHFTKAIVDNANQWLTTDDNDNRGLEAETFNNLKTVDITLFLQQFMNAGKKLTLEITY